MRGRRRTLRGMDLEQLDRILAFVCDTIDRTGGDWDATEAAILERYTGEEELATAENAAVAYLILYAEPGGPAMVRGMRDRRRGLVPALPAGAPGRGLFGRQPA